MEAIALGLALALTMIYQTRSEPEPEGRANQHRIKNEQERFALGSLLLRSTVARLSPIPSSKTINPPLLIIYFDFHILTYFNSETISYRISDRNFISVLFRLSFISHIPSLCPGDQSWPVVWPCGELWDQHDLFMQVRVGSVVDLTV